MHNPRNSSAKPIRQIFSIKRLLHVIEWLLIVILAIGILGSFLLLWENQAYSASPKTQIEIRHANATIIVNVTSTIFVQNYFPFRMTQIRPSVSGADGPITNSASSLKANNITIYSYSIKREYMGEEIRSPFEETNPPTFMSWKLYGMSDTTYTVNWSYNTTSLTRQIHLSLAQADIGLPTISQDLRTVVYPIVIYLFFAGAGFTFSWLAFERGKLMKDYTSLTRFTSKGWVRFTSKGPQKVTDEKEEKGLVKSLKRLIDFPNQTGSGRRMAFAMSIFIFKSIVNIKCKKYNDELDKYKITPHKKGALKKVFSKYSKRSLEAIRDALPELKSIYVAIGFLTSVGISFSWNLGAAAPFVASIGLFYFFLNIGSLFYFVGKSKTDVVWMFLTMGAGIVVVSFPRIIDFLRANPLF